MPTAQRDVLRWLTRPAGAHQRRERTRTLWVVLACALPALAALIAVLMARDEGIGDYANPVCADWKCDDPATALHAIARGDVGGFFRAQPAMGLTSLALRAPVVAIVHGAGGGIRAEYEGGAAICLAAASLIVVLLARFAWTRGASLPAALSALALWMVAIVWGRALLFGHPEEPLAGALAVAAIALAAARRPIAAGMLLGLAIGTKEWALLVAPAVLFAGRPMDWRQLGAAALAGVVLTTGVMFAGNPSSFRSAHEGQRAGDERTLTPATLWYRLGDKRVTGRAGDQVLFEVYPPKLIGRWCRPFVIVFTLLAALLFARRRGWQTPAAFALAAFVLLARGLLDTQTFSYHLIPMLMAIAAWELFALRRLPVIATIAMVAFQLTARVVASSADISSYGFNAIFLAWTLPLAALLAVAAFRAAPSGTRWSRDPTDWVWSRRAPDPGA
jgi:hypothetical protein